MVGALAGLLLGNGMCFPYLVRDPASNRPSRRHPAFDHSPQDADEQPNRP
jgi:hypothetical protein